MSVLCVRVGAWPAAPEAEAAAAARADGRGSTRARDRSRAAGQSGRDAVAVESGPAPELVASLAALVPRLAVEARGVVWADVKGLPGEELAEAVLARLAGAGVDAAGAGLAGVPVAAEVAAGLALRGGPERPAGLASVGERTPAPGGEAGASALDPKERLVRVTAGGERAFLAGLPLAVLEPEPALASLLEGVGLATCGALAALEREPVEVRFGPECVRLWRRARADDRRRLFGRIPPERPSASVDFVDYVVTDPARLVFTANALLGSLLDPLRDRGEHVRRLLLVLPLADGSEWRRELRAARPTASRERWLRLLRRTLERVSVADAVAGVRLEVDGAEPASVQQGDLFDRGFGTAGAVEAAVARLLETQGPVVLAPERSRHALLERSVRWVARSPAAAAGVGEPVRPGTRRRGRRAGAEAAAALPPRSRGPESAMDPPAQEAGDVARAVLTLQLLPEPRRVRVEAARSRGVTRPVRLRDRDRWRSVVTAAGPDRISGGHWDRPYAREYFRCVTDDGALLWVFRDARGGEWYVHGWWD